MFIFLDTETTVKNKPGAESADSVISEIAFEQVDFSYGEDPVLRELTFTVRAGERIAIVGGSGAGKTTLVNLLPRFFDVTAGRILLNNKDLRDLDLSSLRGKIGLVTQETFLFNRLKEKKISELAFSPQAFLE